MPRPLEGWSAWGALAEGGVCPPPARSHVAVGSRCRRKDVLVLTPWLAPIVWEGTFNIDILNEQFRLQNVTVGLTVFAIKK